MGKHANKIKHPALHLIISCSILGWRKQDECHHPFPLRFLINQQNVYMQSLILSLRLVPVERKYVGVSKTALGRTMLGEWRLHILSGSSYEPSSKFVVKLLRYDLRYAVNFEIWPALFKKYLARYLLCLLYISLNSGSFYEVSSDIIFSKWFGFAWPVLPN